MVDSQEQITSHTHYVTPRIIWQTWKTKNNLPVNLFLLRKEWEKTHSDYTHILLDDSDLRKIVGRVVPEYLSDYDSFSHTIERVDFARYAILFEYGGVYADLDTKPLKKIDVWVDKNKIILGCESSRHAENLYGRERVVCNAFMISPPKHTFWKELMKYIVSNYERNYKPVETTGPMVITKFLDEHPEYERRGDIVITEPCTFYPLLGNRKVDPDCKIEDSYVMHVWQNSWVEPWYKSIVWKNARYWTYFLLALYSILWLYLYFSGV